MEEEGREVVKSEEEGRDGSEEGGGRKEGKLWREYIEV